MVPSLSSSSRIINSILVLIWSLKGLGSGHEEGCCNSTKDFYWLVLRGESLERSLKDQDQYLRVEVVFDYENSPYKIV